VDNLTDPLFLLFGEPSSVNSSWEHEEGMEVDSQDRDEEVYSSDSDGTMVDDWQKLRESLWSVNQLTPRLDSSLVSLPLASVIFSCLRCGKPFPSRVLLRRHLKNHPPAETVEKLEAGTEREAARKGFTCSKCSKVFTLRTNLLRHERNSHPTATCGVMKKYSCKLCPKSFTQKADLQRHEEVHLRKKPFQCSLCERGFGQKTHLRGHMVRVHHTKLSQ